jgi:putative transcriptional regulator
MTRQSDERTVKALRLAKGWTQMRLANEAQVSLSTISNLETGRYQPSLALALKISKLLGATVEGITWLDNPKPRPKEQPAA